MQPGDDHGSFWERLFLCVTPESAEALIRAETGFDASAARVVWNAHRAAAERAESRLEGRARDLEGLQAFGRALADARSVPDVLDRAAVSLQVLPQLARLNPLLLISSTSRTHRGNPVLLGMEGES